MEPGTRPAAGTSAAGEHSGGVQRHDLAGLRDADARGPPGRRGGPALSAEAERRLRRQVARPGPTACRAARLAGVLSASEVDFSKFAAPIPRWRLFSGRFRPLLPFHLAGRLL